MEDSTAMTIEFLRARLLAERSVSKSAKERADDLSKKVLELEEQLRVLTLQRKKAEKATVEVLAILENSGIDDYTESFDSNSDEERVLNEFKEGSINEENPMACRPRDSKEEDVSGSEREGTLIGRSLSWKSCNSSPNSREKKKDTESRWRHYSFLATGDSSTKSLVGKSCRKIKRKETRSATDEVSDDCVPHDAQENGLASASTGQASPEDPGNEISAEVDVTGGKRDVFKGEAEENNAQLINRYEAEEIAQREWEEKFKANDDCCEHGKQEDITEESKEIEKTAEHPDTNSSADEVANLEGKVASLIQEAIVNTFPNGSSYAICPDMGCSQVLQHSTSVPGVKIDSEFSFPNQEISVATAEREVKQEWSDTACSWSSEHPSNKNLQLKQNGSQHNGESSSEDLNELQLAIWHEKPNELETVLEALQRAKLSLKHELNRSSLSSPALPLVKMPELPLPAIETVDAMKIPSSCSGLFRVPTDLESEARCQANLLPPNIDQKVSLTRNCTSMGVASNAQCSINPGLKMGVPTDLKFAAHTGANLLPPQFDPKVLARNEQHNTNLVLGIGSRDSSLKPYFDPWMDAGLTVPASSMFKYPSYAELIPQMPSTKGARKNSSSLGDLLRDRSSIYNH